MRRTITAALLAMPAAVFAQGGYLGAQYAMITVDSDGTSEDIELAAAVIRGGYRATEHVGVEGRVGVGVGDYTSGVYNLEINQLFGIYATGWIPLGDVADVYAAAGFAGVEMEASSAYGSTINDDTGVSYGGGIHIYPGDRVALNGEWMFYLDEDDYDATAVSLGIAYRFQ